MGFHPFHAKVTLDPFHATGLSLPWSQRFGPNQPGKNIANESAANNLTLLCRSIQNSWCSLLQSPEQNAANNRGFCCYSTQNKGLVKIKAQEISKQRCKLGILAPTLQILCIFLQKSFKELRF